MAYNQSNFDQSPISGITLSISAAANPVSSFTLSAAANAVSGNTLYTGSFTNFSFTYRTVIIAGFTNSNNNGTFFVLSNTATTMVVQNANGVAEAHVATATLDHALSLYTVNGTVPAVLQVQGNAEYTIVITGFTTNPTQNNGTFFVQGATAGYLSIINPSSLAASGQTAMGVITTSYFTAGTISLRGDGQGAYLSQGIPSPSLLTISANPNSNHQIWTVEGDSTDSAGIDMFHDPDGNHGWEMWSSYDGTGENPSFFEMAYEDGPFISLMLPDEATGFEIGGTHIIPEVGDSTTITFFALSDTTTTNFSSGITINGTTGAVGNADLTLDNVAGITLSNAGAGGTTINDTGGSGFNVNVSGSNPLEGTIAIMSLYSTGWFGTEIEDDGGGGLTIETSSDSAPTPFAVTSVDNASAGMTVYNGTFPTTSLGGFFITITGFTNPANNGTFAVSVSTVTTLTLDNANGAAETNAATAMLASFVSITNNGAGGTGISDTGGGGVTVGASGTDSFIFLSNTGDGGTSIFDQGIGGITITAGVSVGVGTSSVQIGNLGTGGTYIQDEGGGGITFHNSNPSNGDISITDDNSSGGIYLTANNTVQTANTGVGGTIISDSGGGVVSITSEGGISLSNSNASNTSIIDSFGGITINAEAGNLILETTGAGTTSLTLSTNGSGGLILHGVHLNNNPANPDIQGNISSVSGTTVSYSYATSFTDTPTVVVTPTTNAGSFYLSASSNTGFTITYTISGAQTFNYFVIGNPN